MDELVRQALAKWPDVPDCTGWLALDARGRWRAGDAKAGQRLPITHAAMNAYIARNYFSSGRYWIFQNGPQRVFVELEYTPFVFRLHPRAGDTWDVIAQTGATTTPSALWLDDDGRFLMEARLDTGVPIVGVVHDHDTAVVAELLRGADGAPLDDERLASVSMSPADDQMSSNGDTRTDVVLHLAMADASALRLPLQRIASDHVPARFDFEPKPSLALRVDADTRR